mgnify:CR=1 FL=1
MKKQKVEIELEVYENISELPKDIQELMNKAQQARENAYGNFGQLGYPITFGAHRFLWRLPTVHARVRTKAKIANRRLLHGRNRKNRKSEFGNGFVAAWL